MLRSLSCHCRCHLHHYNWKQISKRSFFFRCEGIENRVVAAANQYIDQNKSNDEEKHELREIASSLTKMGLKTQNDGSSISLGCVRYFHGPRISQVGEQMLKEMYGITKKTIQLDSGIVF